MTDLIRRSTRVFLPFCAVLLVLMAGHSVNMAGQSARNTQPYFTEPAISPDGSEIAFVSGGDIWTVPSGGSEAHLLVSNPANESRPLYSPDGRRLAFVSARTGSGDIYELTLDTGDLKRLTFDDSNDQLDAWSADGHWLYFTSSSRDISGMNDIVRVSVDGGTPMQVTADSYTNEYAIFLWIRLADAGNAGALARIEQVARTELPFCSRQC